MSEYNQMETAIRNVEFATDDYNASLRALAKAEAQLAADAENLAWCKAELAQLIADEAEEAEEAEEARLEALEL